VKAEAEASGGMLPYLASLEIQSQASADAAGALLTKIKSEAKALEAKRTSVTGPINEALRAVNDLFRGPRENYAKAEAILKGKIGAFVASVAQARVEAMQAEAPAVAPAALPSNMSSRVVRRFEIVDAAQIPREYLQPNAAAIQASIDAGVDSIPGVRVFEQVLLAVRSV
jgi:hypothetical protein